MPEPAEPNRRPSDITRLLFKAVKGLPEEEQRAVFEYFFERGIGMAQPPFPEAFGGSGAGPEAAIAPPAVRLVTADKRVGPAHVMMPVRLTEAQHRRLKQWCAENNFPMAVVVRGLVDRFLDSWEKRAG